MVIECGGFEIKIVKNKETKKCLMLVNKTYDRRRHLLYYEKYEIGVRRSDFGNEVKETLYLNRKMILYILIKQLKKISKQSSALLVTNQ